MLAKLQRGSRDGVQVVEHIEAPGEIEFALACQLGLEGIVSKRRDMPCRHGRSRAWLKIKKPAEPAAIKREAIIASSPCSQEADDQISNPS